MSGSRSRFGWWRLIASRRRWAAPFAAGLCLVVAGCSLQSQRGAARPEAPEVGEEKEDSPLEAAAFRYYQRVGPDGTIPAAAIMEAKRQRDRLVMESTSNAGIAPDAWTWLGPGNIGGRIRTIVLHPTNPSTMWIGSASGGIWKTTNAGARWEPLTDFMASLSVGCMAMDPVDPTIIYAGTGEGFFEDAGGASNTAAVQGAGIFRTTDGGDTWTQMESTATPDFHYVNRLVIGPDSRATLLAATGAGVFRSTDAGASWTRTLAINALDAKFHPTDGSQAIASGHDPGSGPYYSTDGGVTWSMASGIPDVHRVELAYARSNPSVVYAGVSDHGTIRIWRSTDGGRTYAQRPAGGISTYEAYNSMLWVDPTNSETLLWGGIGISRSTNGGGGGSGAFNGVHADQHVVVEHPDFDGVNNRTVYFGCDGGIYRTDNVYGNSAVELNNNLGITQFYGAAINDQTGVVVGGTQDNGTLRYTGSTEGWGTTFGGDGGYCASDPTDPNYFYGEIYWADIFRSTNGGQSANYISSGITDAGDPNAANFITYFTLDPNNPNRILLCARHLWRTNNAKAGSPTWRAIKPPIGGLDPGDPDGAHFNPNPPYNLSTVTVAQGNSDLIFAGHNNGQIWYTTDGTADNPTWTRIDNAGGGAPPARWVSRIAIDPANPSRIYVAYMGWEPDNLWTSVAPFTEWRPVGNTGDYALPAAPLSALALHPTQPGWVYVGGDIGLFASTDGGRNWSTTTQGPGTVPVEELVWRDGDTLMAVTHGRGIYLADVRLDLAMGDPIPGVAGQDNAFPVRNATANERVYFVWGFNSGSTHVPGCNVFVGISRPQFGGSAVSDADGAATLVTRVPQTAAGRPVLLQAVEPGACRLSQTVEFTFQ